MLARTISLINLPTQLSYNKYLFFFFWKISSFKEWKFIQVINGFLFDIKVNWRSSLSTLMITKLESLYTRLRSEFHSWEGKSHSIIIFSTSWNFALVIASSIYIFEKLVLYISLRNYYLVYAMSHKSSCSPWIWPKYHLSQKCGVVLLWKEDSKELKWNKERE